MKELYIELADTNLKRTYGLMDRKSMGQNDGMLFKFPRPNFLRFWMSNTYIPLQIAFVDDRGKILQIEKMSPLSTRAITSQHLCRYALEVNDGWFSENNIQVGSKMGGIGFPTIKTAQDNMLMSPVEDENPMLPYTMPMQEGEELPAEQETYEPAPDVQLNRSNRDKIEYAENHNRELEIIYWSIKGPVLPPRRLQQIQNEGYPIFSGPNGDYFKAVDVSPSIIGGGYEITSMHPKSFILDNIISLEIIENIEGNQEEFVENNMTGR